MSRQNFSGTNIYIKQPFSKLLQIKRDSERIQQDVAVFIGECAVETSRC